MVLPIQLGLVQGGQEYGFGTIFHQKGGNGNQNLLRKLKNLRKFRPDFKGLYCPNQCDFHSGRLKIIFAPTLQLFKNVKNFHVGQTVLVLSAFL